MSSAQLAEPSYLERSGSSQDLRVEESSFAHQQDESLLEVQSNTSVQPTPNYVVRNDPLDQSHEHDDEPPPPYEEPVADAPQIAPVEYSCENSPQLLVAPNLEFIAPPPRNPARLSGSHSRSSSSNAISLQSQQEPNLYPAPLQLRTASESRSSAVRTNSSQAPETLLSSSKAREAGFEIQAPVRSESTSSLPSITVVSSSEPLRHTREPGKLTAYLIPFPKPRLQGVRVEDVPDRFLVYTPPAPPLSKPGPGEKESQWHKTQRKWQEDVRRATMSNASPASWKGMKAKATIAIGKGVSMTKTTNLEFLDRVTDGAITSTVESTPDSATPDAPNSPPSSPPTAMASAFSVMGTGADITPHRKRFNTSQLNKPKSLEELTLVYPPSLPSNPKQIRSEFVDSLLRTREKSRRDAVVASTLFPFAAAIDASLIFTLGGLTEVSGVWAHSSIRGVVTSKRMTKGLQLGEKPEADEEHEVQGCTCGHHEDDFGIVRSVPKDKGKAKEKEKGTPITLRMQQSSHLEILRRYLELACLKKDFAMFPQLDEVVGDVNEAAVLEAIGWQPQRREGSDLEVEDNKGKVQKLTPEQDEGWQAIEARQDVRRIMKKGAKEWVAWCKSFQKEGEAALKK